MTTLGKILVFVNLVFSLVTGALIIMVFSVRTNWKAGYDKMEQRFRVSEANVKAYAEEAREAKSKADAEVKRLSGEVEKVTKDREDLRKDNLKKDEEIKVALEKAKLTSVGNTDALAELQRRRDEVTQLQGILADRDKKLLEWETKFKVEQDGRVRNEVAVKSLNDQNQRLVQTVESMSREMEKLKSGGSGGTIRGEPIATKPPHDVKGVVLDTDLKNQLVTISLGSDAGINKGNVLEVYRFKPEPKYLGRLRILEVNHHQAVGRPESAQRTAVIQKGDTVASHIMNQQ